MPLQSSGPIFLQNIVNEFGGTTPHSLSEYYKGGSRVPNTAANINIPTSGTIRLSNFYGASRTTNSFIATVAGSADDGGRGIAVDSSGNIYVVGYTVNPTNSNGYDIFVSKYDSDGIILWQRCLGSTQTDNGQKIAVSSTGNVYIIGNGGGVGTLVAKYNTNGVLQWQRSYGYDPFLSANGQCISIDSSENVYIGAYLNLGIAPPGGFIDGLIVKYDTNGNVLWQRGYGDSAEQATNAIAVDSLANVYISGYAANSGFPIYGSLFVAKYNTSGTLQWGRSFVGSTKEFGTDSGISLDSSSNVYVVGTWGYTDSGTDVDFFLAKFNTNGNILWQRAIGGFGSNDIVSSVSSDSSGNTYLIGNSNAANGILIVKYDTNGVLQWQRSLGTPQGDSGIDIKVLSPLTKFYCTGRVNINPSTFQGDLFFAKLPIDGTLTGSYGNFSYSTILLPAYTATATVSTTAFPSVSRSLTSTASNLTSSNVTINTTRTFVP